MASARDSLLRLLREHHVASLSTLGEEGPYATPLFYAVDETSLRLLFLSDSTTRHVRDLAADPRAAMAVYLETRSVGRIQGLQLTGVATALEGQEEKEALAVYDAAFPLARAHRLGSPGVRLYAFRVDWAKITDNRLGFGHKQEWRRPSDAAGAGRTHSPRGTDSAARADAASRAGSAPQTDSTS